MCTIFGENRETGEKEVQSESGMWLKIVVVLLQRTTLELRQTQLNYDEIRKGFPFRSFIRSSFFLFDLLWALICF